MIFRLEPKHTERMLDIKSGYLPSPDKFILLVLNKHKLHLHLLCNTLKPAVNTSQKPNQF
jgi:hypothetical protein